MLSSRRPGVLFGAIADRHPPPTPHITATGTNLNILRRTGDRLSKFAHSLGLIFRFLPLLLPQTNINHTVNTTTPSPSPSPLTVSPEYSP
ncbi:hypothetical protein L1887_10211 [Cichorium endivia]|nr:hypothetical protein L1887_10211 [Cichorium endivia]